MYRISPTGILNSYKSFSKEFWLSYKALEKVLPEIQFADLKMKLLKSKKIILESIEGLDIELFNTERALLDKEWTEKNEEAKQIGTTTHEQIHNLFCTDLRSVKTSLGIDTDKYQVKSIEDFLNTERGIFTEFKMEIPLEEDVTIVGIADCIIKEGNHVKIIDWKTDEKIPFRSIYDLGKKKNKRFKFPLCDLEDCPGIQYQLQLSLYARMLQYLDPTLIIDDLVIVQIQNMKKVKEFHVEYLKSTIDKLLKWHIKSLRLKTEMDKCNEIIY